MAKHPYRGSNDLDDSAFPELARAGARRRAQRAASLPIATAIVILLGGSGAYAAAIAKSPKPVLTQQDTVRRINVDASACLSPGDICEWRGMSAVEAADDMCLGH